jgi:antitoxin component YwqK of YwqJK toxin-antitoxin module
VRILIGLLALAGCVAAPASSSRPAAHAVRCPPESELRIEGDHSILIERCVRRGTEVNHGPMVIRRRPQGELEGEEHWRDGKQEGVFRSYDERGALASEERYQAGLLVHRTAWTNRRKVEELDQAADGRRHEVVWDLEGHKIRESDQSADGATIGTIWVPTGAMLAVRRTRNGRLDGVQWRGYPDGTPAAEKTWRAGIREGTWRYFYRSGKKSQERDFAGGQEIAHRAWNQEGRVRSLPEIGPAGCTSDADCTISYAGSYAGPECCPQDVACGGVVSRSQLERFGERCLGVYCGEPQASSSCLGIMRLHPVCRQGLCVSAPPT